MTTLVPGASTSPTSAAFTSTTPSIGETAMVSANCESIRAIWARARSISALAGDNVLLAALGLDGIRFAHLEAGAGAFHLRGGAFDGLAARPGLYQAGLFLGLFQVGARRSRSACGT